VKCCRKRECPAKRLCEPSRRSARRSTVPRALARVVIDANVLVSAIFGGVPAQAVSRAFEEEVCISPIVMREIAGLRKKLVDKLTLQQMLRWEASLFPLVSKMTLFKPRIPLRLSRDRKDDAYLSLARAARADYIITGDQDLLCLSEEDLARAGIETRIVTPREFLDQIDNRE
jgi:putative PIN family toxin of toxin-antitoxin system